MPTVHYLGKIVPDTYFKVTMWDLPNINADFADIDLKLDIVLRVKEGAVDVECSANRFDEEARGHIYKIAYDLVRAAVNLMSFKTGTTFSVYFDQFLDESGVLSSLAIQAPALATLATSYELTQQVEKYGLGDILKIVWREPALFMALDDLITATSLHTLITINSARSIERLRHAMAKPGMSRSQAWEHFRENLQMGEAYLHLITDNSQSARHGEEKHVPGDV